MNRVFKDLINPHHLGKYSCLIAERIPVRNNSSSLAIGDHLLFFNALNKNLGKDGYFDHQSPRLLLDDTRCDYSRRVWAKGHIQILKPLLCGHEYECQEKVRFVKKIRGDHYVCLERLVQECNGETMLRELRTLAYTNSQPITRYVGETKPPDGTPLGSFTFRDLDIVIYSQLSSNPHRIHWDREYSRTVEGYRDIIVQGPFALQVLLNFARNAINSPITDVEYRNYNYIYPDTEVEVILSSRKGEYHLCMSDAKNPEIVFLRALVPYQ